MVIIPLPLNFVLWLVKMLLSNEGCDVCKLMFNQMILCKQNSSISRRKASLSSTRTTSPKTGRLRTVESKPMYRCLKRGQITDNFESQSRRSTPTRCKKDQRAATQSKAQAHLQSSPKSRMKIERLDFSPKSGCTSADCSCSRCWHPQSSQSSQYLPRKTPAGTGPGDFGTWSPSFLISFSCFR